MNSTSLADQDYREVARYLRSVAAALAAPDATTAHVLASAGATDLRRQPYFVDFRPPTGRLGLGSVQLDRYDPVGRAPEAVNFELDSAADPILFKALADLLGSWRQVPAGSSPMFANFVQFEALGAGTRQLGHPFVEVRFNALLSAPPGDPSARLMRVGMRRDVFE